MLGTTNALEIIEVIIERVSVAMVDDRASRESPVRLLPDMMSEEYPFQLADLYPVAPHPAASPLRDREKRQTQIRARSRLELGGWRQMYARGPLIPGDGSGRECVSWALALAMAIPLQVTSVVPEVPLGMSVQAHAPLTATDEDRCAGWRHQEFFTALAAGRGDPISIALRGGDASLRAEMAAVGLRWWDQKTGLTVGAGLFDGHVYHHEQSTTSTCCLSTARSGTTGLVAVEEGRRFLGFELSEEYCKMARDRIGAAQLPLVMA